MLRRGRGGGRGYVLHTVHRPSTEIGNSLYFHAMSFFQMCCIVYTQIYNIYQNNYEGKCWPWYSCRISKRVCKTKSVN